MKYLLIATILITGLSFGQESIDIEVEKETIKAHIEKHYIQALYKGKHDYDLVRAGFYPDFRMYVLYQGKYYTRTLPEWIERLQVSWKNLVESGRTKRNYTWKFLLVDVVGPTAVAKFTLTEDGRLKFTDYMMLYKFSDGWKITTKHFTMH